MAKEKKPLSAAQKAALAKGRAAPKSDATKGKMSKSHLESAKAKKANTDRIQRESPGEKRAKAEWERLNRLTRGGDR